MQGNTQLERILWKRFGVGGFGGLTGQYFNCVQLRPFGLVFEISVFLTFCMTRSIEKRMVHSIAGLEVHTIARVVHTSTRVKTSKKGMKN